MEDFSKISLGFAEFVSQLLHETFEATLSAQSYQLEKYIEIENILKLPNKRFFDLYLDSDLLEQKTLDIFGVKVENQMPLLPETIAIIENTFDDIGGFVKSGKLTNVGLNAINEYVRDILVNERKGTFQNIINKTEFTRLVVESGEIRAKLELTNLFQNSPVDDKEIDTNSTKVSKGKSTAKTIPSETQIKDVSNVFSGRSVISNNIRMKEIKDTETNEKTLIIDKSSISDQSKIAFSLPNVRIITKPATISSNSNLLSEIVIKFKTV